MLLLPQALFRKNYTILFKFVLFRTSKIFENPKFSDQLFQELIPEALILGF